KEYHTSPNENGRAELTFFKCEIFLPQQETIWAIGERLNCLELLGCLYPADSRPGKVADAYEQLVVPPVSQSSRPRSTRRWKGAIVSEAGTVRLQPSSCLWCELNDW